MTGAATTDTARPPRILIVDDERANRQLLEVMLEAERYELVTAERGAQALAIVAARAPDLILLDVMMPGMNGYQVATALKADPATAQIPIIILSALDDSSSKAHGLSVGVDGFLTKPVNRAHLCALVRRLVHRTA